MKKDNSLSLIVCNGHSLNRAFLHSSLLYLCGMLVTLPLSLLLERLLPMIDRGDWFVLPPVLFFLFIIADCLFSVHKIRLTKDSLLLTWCGIPVKSISLDELRLLCAVGNEQYDLLCLTCHSPDELAQMEEADMLRNYFSKDELPFLKQKADYRDSFARKQALRLSQKPFLLLRNEKTLFLRMDPLLLQQIRALYPELPYRNYTDCKKYTIPYYGSKSYRLCMQSFTTHYSPELTASSIEFYRGTVVKRTVPLSTIQAIVRVDIFMAESKTSPHHLPLLFLSNLSVKEMAEKSTFSHKSNPMKAYKYAHDQAKRWRIDTPDCCNLPCTEDTIAHLKVHCPNAQWLDISEHWLADSPCVKVCNR